METDSLIVRPALSILLYRIDFNKTTRASWSAVGAVEGGPRLPLDLHFLLTAWASNADHEHRILGRAMQVLEGVGALAGPLLDPEGQWAPNETVQLYLEDMATDDLMRTFDSLECDFRLSVPYIARVVVIADEGVPTPEVLPPSGASGRWRREPRAAAAMGRAHRPSARRHPAPRCCRQPRPAHRYVAAPGGRAPPVAHPAVADRHPQRGHRPAGPGAEPDWRSAIKLTGKEPADETRIVIRLVDRSRRFVPRRLSLPVPFLDEVNAGDAPTRCCPRDPAAAVPRRQLRRARRLDRRARSRRWPDDEPAQWVRVRATTAEPIVIHHDDGTITELRPTLGRAHGDDRGEFLLWSVRCRPTSRPWPSPTRSS